MGQGMTSMKKEYVFQPYKIIEVKYRGNDCPRPRSGHRIACDDANIYLFGGYNPSLPLTSIELRNPTWTPACPLFKELWCFSIVSRRWKQYKIKGNMPEELASSAMCVNGKYLMIFGGTGAPFGYKCSNDVILAQPEGDSAELKVLEASGAKPPGQYGQAILSYDGYFYTIGGTNGFAYNCDVYRLDLRTLEWEQVFIGTGQEGEPRGRYRHEVTRIGDKLYVFGGGTGDWAFELMEVPVFDLETRKWTLEKPKGDASYRNTLAPIPRKCHSAVLIYAPDGPQVFVAGGSDGQSVFEDIWRLNVNDMQWTLMKETYLPHPLYFHSASASSDGCMYMFGGIEPKEEATARNNILYKAWMCIPKLSEMCWEAMIYYYPNIDQWDRKTLLDLGIPIHLVNRVHLPPSYNLI